MPSLADITRIDRVRLPVEPVCPEVPAGHRLVFLIDAATTLEERLAQSWAERCAPTADVMAISPSRIRRRGRPTDPRVGTLADTDQPAWLVPLRVAWLPSVTRSGTRAVSWMDVLKLGDPRDPRWLRDYLILFLFPDRVRLVVGQGAAGSDLAAARTDDHVPFTQFVTRRAWLALDRAERAERGDRYKIPRFLAEDITSSPAFRAEAIAAGAERGLSPARAYSRARYYLSEIAATHSPFLIDLIANLIHWVIRQGYGAIHYDPAAVRDIAHLGRDHPLVFLPSHKSNLDRLSMQFVRWENDLPPNHTAGGINMNFFPVGPLVRRTGVFFIRRSFKGNELYKFVLRSYIDYLVEKRFPLEWYMEGGRSRTGKLRPPRFGLLSWMVDSHRRGKAEDIMLIPVSIAYDHIHEVGAYVTEATGGRKEEESFSWALKFARGLRRRYGDIHIRFAEPLSLAKNVGGDADGQVRKLALEVMYRISMATPITPTALVATLLLAARGKGRDIEAITSAAAELVGYVERRRLPTTVPSLPTQERDVLATLQLMADHRLVSVVTAADRTVYWMDAEQLLRSAYYANTVIHYFVPRGIAEVALAAPDLDGFWSDVMKLRDLLKFEFFFAGTDEFRQAVEAELDGQPGWPERVVDGNGGTTRLQPSVVGFAVLPFLEAYQVVADELAATDQEPDKKAFLTACLERGRLYRLEGRIESEESVSQAVFAGAVELARHRGLWEAPKDSGAGRAEFAAEISRFRLTAAQAGGSEADLARTVGDPPLGAGDHLF